jgi:P27 family predicted phage terminase small subunit
MPSHLKIIRNSRSKKKPSPLEPKPVGDLKDAPDHFDAEEREVWNYAIENAPRGLLKRIDSGVLEVWCKSHVLHRTAVSELRKTGLLVKAPHTGLPIQSPFLPIINKQALIMMRAIDHLGFSPASRTRIMMGEKPLSTAGGWDNIESAG